MKNIKWIFLLVLLQHAGIALAKVPVNIYKPEPAITVAQKNDLALLCKVWGLLKYHHPAVIKGTYNWDEELIKFLPAYSANKGKADRNKILLQWVSKFGAVPKSQPIPDSLLANAKLVPDYTWIRKSKLPAELADLLVSISNYHSPDDQKYVKFLADDDIVIPTFINEEAYPTMTYPAVDYRLLAVFRYWNIIEYWYPYRYLARQKWEDCLTPFIVEAIAAKDELAYARLVQKMAGTIMDSHATVNFKKRDEVTGKWVMPFMVKFIEDKAVINSVDVKSPEVAGLQVGNIVQAIDGVPVEKIVDDKRLYVSASNKAVVLREVARLLNRSSDSTSKITITANDGATRILAVRNSLYKHYAAAPYDFPYQKDSSCFVLPGNVLYVNAGAFKASQVDRVKRELKKVNGLVLDARQYPRTGAGDVISLLQGLLLADKGAMSKFSTAVKGYPGLFRYAKPFIIGEANADHYKGKVAILVNEETQSTSEFLTMAYQLAPRALVVGSTTAGADGNVSYAFPLPGGFMTQITGLGVYYPNGRETQQVGIVPDVKVVQTINGFRNHKDDLLDKAVAVINGK
ncbi:hypothetical protein KXD93_19845 [Mucilaginibacter sp. BJC16-A38]|uniref:S41 family peptidase n=1 Tax=Mucilaginibacter phenanthrenivorans TaxID=1234842 RepID=UPI002157E34C|nr:S41 family peptidase [Mucilaginibacter phenanthrenivorans]MCR8559914.1 hypothetical protein [Mucilaginibacter phenanthrenivorans]